MIESDNSPINKIVFLPSLSARNYPANKGDTVRQTPVNNVDSLAFISLLL